MAAVLAELAVEEGTVAEEGAVGGESKFKSDSASNAEAQGVSPSKLAGGVISLAASLLNLEKVIRRGQEERQDIKERRYQAGLLLSSESRNSLVSKGLIPAYYSGSNIRRLIVDGIVPYGWTPLIASTQGFANEVQAYRLRQRRSKIAAQRADILKRQLNANKITLTAENVNRQAAAEALANKIRQSVVG